MVGLKMIISTILHLRNRVIGQEDCLRLNIYTPDLPVTQNQLKLPVLVWLFGKFDHSI